MNDEHSEPEQNSPQQNHDFSDINANLADGFPGGQPTEATAGDAHTDEEFDDEFGDEFDGGVDQETIDALGDAQRAMDDARARLADVPAEVVVTNHVMGLYELAAIHLSADPPDLGQAAFAIDAVACLVDGLGDRLGDDAPTMRDALNNIRLAFVQIKGAAGTTDS